MAAACIGVAEGGAATHGGRQQRRIGVERAAGVGGNIEREVRGRRNEASIVIFDQILRLAVLVTKLTVMAVDD